MELKQSEELKSLQLFKFALVIFTCFLRFGHPDPEGSGRVSRQDCIQMPSYHLKPKSALKQIN